MLKLRAILILFSILLAAVLGNAEAKRLEEKASLDNEMPLDFLTFSNGKEVETMFGYEIIEFIHRERLQCSISLNKENFKFSEKMDRLMHYFKHTQRTVVQPEFELLSGENKKDIEENFHNTFKDIEVSHLQKLSRMQTRCDEEIELYMDNRLELVMDYATTIRQADEAEFDQLLANMNAYQSQLENGLNDCLDYMERNKKKEHFEKAGMYYDLCYGNEVIILDKLITKFITLAQKLTEEPGEKEIVQLPVTAKIELHEIPIPEEKKPEIVPTEIPEEVVFEEPQSDIESSPEDLEDDEDSDYEPSGKGEPEKTSTIPLTEKSTTLSVPEMTTFSETTTADLKQKIAEAETTELAEMTTVSESVATTVGQKQKIAEEFLNSREPGPVIIKDPEFPEISEKAFERVKAMQDAAKEKESSEQSRSSSKSNTKEKDLDIDIELPGIDVEIDESGVKVDAQGLGEGVIIFDPAPTTEAPEHDHHSKHDFKTLFFIYFFATLGILLAITMCVLLVVIIRLKITRNTSLRNKDQPLLSEEDKITILKQSGYVNPTYKFFDEVKDV